MKKNLLLLFLCILLVSSLHAQERKIKAGDVIEIVVYGHTELSRVVTVNPQGAIDFPFMQSVPVDGLSLDKLREIIVATLSRYLNTYPVVTVSFAKSNTINVSVLGMVKRPGLVAVPLNSSLQGALAIAEGVTPGARINEITLIRNIDGRMISSTYDMEKFLLDSDFKQNPTVTEGDIIMVSGNPVLASIKVLGAVRSPGIFDNYMGATVLDMIMRAGGPLEDAKLDQIRYISPSRKKNVEYTINLKQFLETQEFSQVPPVKAGDIIYIPKKKNYWKGVLSVARDISTLAIAAWYIVRINKE